MIAYFIGSIGIPVYLHYCDGELEKITYLKKATNCCGEESDDSEEDENGCCKNENVIVKNVTDFTFKNEVNKKLTISILHLFNSSFFIPLTQFASNENAVFKKHLFPPPKRMQINIVSTSVLII